MPRGTSIRLALVLACLLPGCSRLRWWEKPAVEPSSEATAALGQRLAGDAGAAASALQDARFGVLAAANTVGQAYQAALTVPATSAWAPRLKEVAADLSGAVVPKIEEALAHVEAIRSGAGEVEAVAEGLERMAAERDAAIKARDQAEADRDSALRQLLMWFVAFGVGGTAIGIALAIFSNRKLGGFVATLSLILFGTAGALYESLRVLHLLRWVISGALVLAMLAGVFLLILALRARWKQFREVVLGGQKVKDELAKVGETVSERADAAVDYLRSLDFRKLFNTAQEEAQTVETSAAVDRLKEAEGRKVVKANE